MQSLAARQYLPEVNEYLDRDYLNEYDSRDAIKLIMNGWYMAETQNWPPSDSILPLLVSFHITHDYDANQKLFSPEALAFYKKHEPIGCRDYYTKQLMENHGIKAFYSGCLTLTLKRSLFNASTPRSDKVYLVDILYKMEGRKINLLRNWKRNWIIEQILPPELLKKAETITQILPKRTSEEEKFKIAETALKKYADARLVITSRIHCALPCIAFGTPVLFIDGGLDENTDTTRLNGIAEYFNSYSIAEVINSYRGFLTEFFTKSKFPNRLNIDWANIPENPSNHLEIAENLRQRCKKFIGK